MTAKKRKKDGLKPIITTETAPPVLACKVQQQQVQSESSPVSRHSERETSQCPAPRHAACLSREMRPRSKGLRHGRREGEQDEPRRDDLSIRQRQDGKDEQTRWLGTMLRDRYPMGLSRLDGVHHGRYTGKPLARDGHFSGLQNMGQEDQGRSHSHPIHGSPAVAVASNNHWQDCSFAFAGPAMRSTLKCTSSTCLALQSACATIGMDTSEDKYGDERRGFAERGTRRGVWSGYGIFGRARLPMDATKRRCPGYSLPMLTWTGLDWTERD
ncbi:hypothetical protein CSHISOI_05049 [Colletotrichum shisoi]|uniref:Uncharacterized protein n=1 Tax=Colletotrichum shisoi TaxID=2078593 RepID=A0A5Q4BTS2_9PEZI|nr:hypothetical protein CSHISOI_05049 [Colletotrichum shisoi]